MQGSRPSAALIADTEIRSLSGKDRMEMIALRDRYESGWYSVVEDGVKRNIFDVPDERIATNALLDLCNGVSQWYTSGGRLSLEKVCSMHADLGLGMVRAQMNGNDVRRDQLTLPPPRDLLGFGPGVEDPSLSGKSRKR